MTEVQEQLAAADMVAEGSPGKPADDVMSGTINERQFSADELEARNKALERKIEQAAAGAMAQAQSAPCRRTISVGRIVLYTLTESDANEINRRRGANANDPAWPFGAVAHFGNHANAGDGLPMLVVKKWSESCVNGQVFLDGNDSLWKTSVTERPETPEAVSGFWHWPPLI